MIDAQNLNDILLQSIGDDEGRIGNDELTCAGDAAGALYPAYAAVGSFCQKHA